MTVRGWFQKDLLFCFSRRWRGTLAKVRDGGVRSMKKSGTERINVDRGPCACDGRGFICCYIYSTGPFMMKGPLLL